MVVVAVEDDASEKVVRRDRGVVACGVCDVVVVRLRRTGGAVAAVETWGKENSAVGQLAGRRHSVAWQRECEDRRGESV